MAISLALSVVAVAVTSASVEALRFERRDLGRTQAEFALAGAQDRAALATIAASGRGRLHWSLPTDDGTVEILAEPERDKLSLSAAADLDETILRKLGATDAQAVKSKLTALAQSHAEWNTLSGADPSPMWRACAPTLISPFGEATKPALVKAGPPMQGPLAWRPGEVWRIRVVSPSGWADDRIVRFTGAPGHPTAVIDRVFGRGEDWGDRCDARLGAA